MPAGQSQTSIEALRTRIFGDDIMVGLPERAAKTSAPLHPKVSLMMPCAPSNTAAQFAHMRKLMSDTDKVGMLSTRLSPLANTL